MTDPDPDNDNDASDASSKTHGLKEDSSVNDQAYVAIDYLPNFAFYTCNEVLTPASETKTLDFEDAFEHHMLKPTMFQEAYNHEDPKQCAKWCAAIWKEFKDMNNHGVRRKVKQSVIPSGRHCIKSKWVFEIKRDRLFQARLVTCRYSQILGINFTKNYAPVMNDVTWHILLVAMIVWKLDAIIVDVETAFLHGNLDEEIYMNLPNVAWKGPRMNASFCSRLFTV